MAPAVLAINPGRRRHLGLARPAQHAAAAAVAQQAAAERCVHTLGITGRPHRLFVCNGRRDATPRSCGRPVDGAGWCLCTKSLGGGGGGGGLGGMAATISQQLQEIFG